MARKRDQQDNRWNGKEETDKEGKIDKHLKYQKKRGERVR